jgi:glucose-1-phosphate thymidylyltransferase
VQVAEGATVRNTRIVGPAIIGPDAVVTDCRIGPGTSVGAGCVLTGAAAENTILMRGAVVRGLRIRDSLIGRGSTVRPGDGGGHRLVVGDDCGLELLT